MRNIAAVVVASLVLVTVGLRGATSDMQKVVFARVFPNPGQIGLFIADANGANERPLVGLGEMDYDAVWSPDGGSIVFTSERAGSAELFRVNPDGTGLERLTTNPAYDDQAAFSPDGKTLVFVSTRTAGHANLWTLDLAARRARPLTSGSGGDFRPSWSPDGQWIAFSSDKGNPMPFGEGRWEHLQRTDIYVMHPDGSGRKQIGSRGEHCGSPKFSADSSRVLVYCMDPELTLEARRFSPPIPGEAPRNYTTRLVSIDVATGTATEVPAGPGVKYNPAFLSGAEIGYIRKDGGPDAGVYYAGGTRGPKGDVRGVAWSPDGTRVAFHRRLVAPPTSWVKAFSRLPNYELTFTGIMPAFSATGDRFVITGRPAPGTFLGATLQVGTSGSNKTDVIYEDKTRNVMAASWSAKGDKILFGLGVYTLFFSGFNGKIFDSADHVEGGAQLATINPDGTSYQEITSGPNNNGFPSMAPDGTRVVFRTFGPDGEGLRIMNLQTKAVTTLTKGYDNFPLWSPRGDLIMFARPIENNYEIFTIHPDGTGEKRLTYAPGNDAHWPGPPTANVSSSPRHAWGSRTKAPIRMRRNRTASYSRCASMAPDSNS